MNLFKYKILIMSLWCACLSLDSYGQQGKSQPLNIASKVVDENGDPIKNAQVTLGEGMLQTFTDVNGAFSIKAGTNSTLLISAKGYQTKSVNLSAESVQDEWILKKDLLFESENDLINLPTGITVSQRQSVGAISKIKGSELESQPDIVFSNALQGRLAGLTTRMTTNGLGNNLPELFVRGLGREGSNGALTIVDGIERPIDFLTAEEIESIEVLKDVSSKILYGPRAANGVVLITTKRGKANTRVIRASAEYGVNMNTRMPEYLGSAEYATLYNEARENDGFAPFYSEADIEGYRQSSGENDQQYPNADYLDYFVRDIQPFRKANVEYSGGTEDARYAMMLGYIGTEGVEKIGRTAKEDRLNIRGNLDVQVTPSLSAFVDGNGIIESRNWGKMNQDALFSAINSHRPNEYPFVINDPNFEGEDAELGVERIPPLGGSYNQPNSLYGDMVYGGFREHQYFYGQTNFGMDLKLDELLEGLSVKSTFTFDNYQFHAANQINNPIRYASETVTGPNGADSTAYVQLQSRGISGNRSEQGDDIARNTGWITNLNYEGQFGKHQIAANLSHFYYRNEEKSRRQDVENTNTYLRAVHSFNDKIYTEATAALMGSNRFSEENRYKFFPSLGVSWIVSEEDFLSKVDHLQFLKVKGSYGLIGYDRATNYYLYDTRYFNSGNVQFGERNQNGVPRTGFDNFGNADLTWETSREFNVGVEGLAFNNSLLFEFNYFNEYRSNIIYDNPGAIYSAVNGSLNSPQNWGEVSNKGLEGSLSWFHNVGDWSYSLGGNFLYVKNTVERTNEVMHPDEYMRQTGLPSDAIFGYVDNGLFRDQQAVDNAPFQALGPYGVGNIRYQDLNGDNVIDERDRKMIGNSFPRTTLGININVNYKGFGLKALGTSELGVDVMRNNSYYQNAGEGKYSAFVRDRFHPVNNPNGSVPALTTMNAVNDFRNSSFWMEDASFFRLKNVELSYQLSNGSWTAKNIRFFARGTNMFVISKIKELDPEVINSGVNNYPLFRTLTGGVSVSF